jgi:hypothetical protein
VSVEEGLLCAESKRGIARKSAGLDLKVKIYIGVQAKLLRLSPPFTLSGRKRLPEEGADFERRFRDDITCHAGTLQGQAEIALEQVRALVDNAVHLRLSRLSFDCTFEIFECREKFWTILLQRLRFRLAPNGHQFIDDLLGLNRKALRFAKSDWYCHLAVAHTGLVFLWNKVQKLENNSFATLDLLGHSGDWDTRLPTRAATPPLPSQRHRSFRAPQRAGPQSLSRFVHSWRLAIRLPVAAANREGSTKLEFRKREHRAGLAWHAPPGSSEGARRPFPARE